jgi:hypothetical protein
MGTVINVKQESREGNKKHNSGWIKQQVGRLKTVNLTNYCPMGQYNNLGWMPVLKKHTGCPVQVWVVLKYLYELSLRAQKENNGSVHNNKYARKTK